MLRQTEFYASISRFSLSFSVPVSLLFSLFLSLLHIVYSVFLCASLPLFLFSIQQPQNLSRDSTSIWTSYLMQYSCGPCINPSEPIYPAGFSLSIEAAWNYVQYACWNSKLSLISMPHFTLRAFWQLETAGNSQIIPFGNCASAPQQFTLACSACIQFCQQELQMRILHFCSLSWQNKCLMFTVASAIFNVLRADTMRHWA